ncbi:O14J1 protein, partial [Tachuris rubrigastra]|nr:O14J1 protein [Tachuris rubrigastra]
LGISLASLLGNGLIISAVACDHHLQTPRDFLLQLSVLNLGFISAIVPKAMSNSFWEIRVILHWGCASQVFLPIFFLGAEFSRHHVLCITYDCYISICKPLHYRTLLSSRACAHMTEAVWATAFLNALLHMASTFSLPLCQGNALAQFFCEV